MTNPSEVYCIRGCTRPDVHFATCPGQLDGSCAGCAPEPCESGLVVCADCRRRIRGILRHTPDLLGRMRALAAHGKAVVYAPVKVFAAAGPASAPEPVSADLVDALLEIPTNLRAWSRHFDLVSLAGIDRVLGDVEQTRRLAAAVIDTHAPDEDGGRHWSIADAMGEWGTERRGSGRHVFPGGDADGDVLIVTPIAESSFDPLLVSKDAAARVQKSESQLRKWVAAGILEPRAKLRDGRGVVTKWYRASEVDAAAKLARDAAEAARFKRLDTPGA